jgi:hypothetical protein
MSIGLCVTIVLISKRQKYTLAGIVSQKYAGIILCTTLPPAGRVGLLEPQSGHRGFAKGHGGLFQNEETKSDRERLRK